MSGSKTVMEAANQKKIIVVPNPKPSTPTSSGRNSQNNSIPIKSYPSKNCIFQNTNQNLNKNSTQTLNPIQNQNSTSAQNQNPNSTQNQNLNSTQNQNPNSIQTQNPNSLQAQNPKSLQNSQASNNNNEDESTNYLNLGDKFFNGSPPDFYVDFEEAAKYYRRAANLGNSKAMIKLGDIYRYGLGVEINRETAKKFYADAAMKKNPDGKKLYDILIYREQNLPEIPLKKTNQKQDKTPKQPTGKPEIKSPRIAKQ